MRACAYEENWREGVGEEGSREGWKIRSCNMIRISGGEGKEKGDGEEEGEGEGRGLLT